MRRHLLLIPFLLVMVNSAFAQMIGTDIFLQGAYLEIGQQNNGAFGACTTPAGYHNHCASCFPATGFAEVYDWGHDGWAVGAPASMGDYTFPGSPFEGWELQIGTGRTQAFQSCPSGAFTAGGGGAGLTGTNTSYASAGGSITGLWTGSAGTGGALRIRQQTRVDQFASAVVVTTVFQNTGAAATGNVYYLRSCDPDNDQTWAGGGFPTHNTIVHQNEDLRHMVMVKALGDGYPAQAYLALATKDCRAKAFIYDSWPLSSATDLSTCWNGTMAGATFNLGGTRNGDIAIGLVYNIGAIPAGDSAIISYAYVFNGDNGIDSAFPDPQIIINNVPHISYAPPTPNFDTFNVCLFPGMTSLPVSIKYATDKDWSWSTWTWSPGTGLATTTGVNNAVDVNNIPATITYTIVGTDSGAHMFSCNKKVFYLTVHTCRTTETNNPCLNDTLRWNLRGDSTNATYAWYGPAPSTAIFSTAQAPWKYPATFSDSGMYHVVKTVGGVSDTDSIRVFIRPLPLLNLTSNSPLCSGMLDTLRLGVVPGGDTYQWSGPSGFTSTQQFPEVPNFATGNDGVYTVIGTTSYGCKDTNTILTAIVPPPGPPTITGKTVYCYGEPFEPFTVIGSNIKWYPTFTSTVSTTVPPIVNTTTPGTYTFYATQTTGCESPKDSITVLVQPEIHPDFTFSIKRGCAGDTVVFTNTSTVATSYTWDFGDGTPTVSDASPMHVYTTQAGPFNVTLTGYYAGCHTPKTQAVDPRHEVHAGFTTADTICLENQSVFTSTAGATIQGGTPGLIIGEAWTISDGSTFTSVPPDHTYPGAGIYHVAQVVTDSIGCQASATKDVYVIQPVIHALNDTTICLTQPFPLDNWESMTPSDVEDDRTYTYTYNWSPSTYLSSDTAHVPTFNAIGLYVYTLTATLDYFNCHAYHTITINSILPHPVVITTASTSLPIGTSIQLDANGVIYYTWTPNDGSLDNPNINNPVATPTVTTTYVVTGYDEFGCRTSASVTVQVDSTMGEMIPSAFTPNGDGNNDKFRLNASKFQNMLEFRIYNRWGEQVYYSTNINDGWDGTYKGVPQDIGTYFYNVIVARKGYANNLIYKGEVTLIR